MPINQGLCLCAATGICSEEVYAFFDCANGAVLWAKCMFLLVADRHPICCGESRNFEKIIIWTEFIHKREP